jgi:hypothetical protein
MFNLEIKEGTYCDNCFVTKYKEFIKVNAAILKNRFYDRDSKLHDSIYFY